MIKTMHLPIYPIEASKINWEVKMNKENLVEIWVLGERVCKAGKYFH